MATQKKIEKMRISKSQQFLFSTDNSRRWGVAKWFTNVGDKPTSRHQHHGDMNSFQSIIPLTFQENRIFETIPISFIHPDNRPSQIVEEFFENMRSEQDSNPSTLKLPDEINNLRKPWYKFTPKFGVPTDSLVAELENRSPMTGVRS